MSAEFCFEPCCHCRNLICGEMLHGCTFRSRHTILGRSLYHVVPTFVRQTAPSDHTPMWQAWYASWLPGSWVSLPSNDCCPLSSHYICRYAYVRPGHTYSLVALTTLVAMLDKIWIFPAIEVSPKRSCSISMAYMDIAAWMDVVDLVASTVPLCCLVCANCVIVFLLLRRNSRMSGTTLGQTNRQFISVTSSSSSVQQLSATKRATAVRLVFVSLVCLLLNLPLYCIRALRIVAMSWPAYFSFCALQVAHDITMLLYTSQLCAAVLPIRCERRSRKHKRLASAMETETRTPDCRRGRAAQELQEM